jgi:hypothetical protein
MSQAPPPPNSTIPPPPVALTPSARGKSTRYIYKFTLSQLAEIWGVTRNTARKRIGNTKPCDPEGRNATVWDLKDVATFMDIRQDASVIKMTRGSIPTDLDPVKKLKLHQANDMEQAYKLKRIKVRKELGKLLEADNVERVVAKAYKSLVMFLDNLPDILERNGLISRDKVVKVARLVDRTRDQMADDIDELVEDDL